MKEKHVCITTTIKTNEDPRILSTIILFVPNKNAITRIVNFLITNFSSCIIQIDIKQSFVNFIQITLKNAIIKVSALLPIRKIKSLRTLSLYIYLKKITTFTFTSIKLFGVPLLKSIFLI